MPWRAVALALVLASCGREAPRYHVSERLIERLPRAARSSVDGDCAIADEHRPSLGCTAWSQWGTSTVGTEARHVSPILRVGAKERGKPLFLKVYGKAPKQSAPQIRLPEPRSIVPRASMVRLQIPNLPAELPEGSTIRIWRRPAPNHVFETTAVRITPGAVLSVGIGLDDSSPAGGVEAVEFALTADAGAGPRELLRERVRPDTPEAAAWQDRTIALDAVVGDATTFRFTATTVPAAGVKPADTVVVPLWGAPEILVPESEDRRPNVILISLDTLRGDYVGALGARWPLTPHIDALAREGVVFENATTTFPSTTAAHLSMLTGIYPIRLGVGDPSRRVHATTALLAEAMGTAGWRTAAVTEDVMLAISVGFSRGVSHYWENLEEERTDAPSYKPEHTVDRALAWLDGHASERFFLFVHTYAVHFPYAPPPEYALTTWDDGGTERPVAEASNQLQNQLAYAGDVRYADAQVGRIVDAVRRLGLAERTIVVITSDHGEAFYEHRGDVWGHSTTIYDPVMRVPVVMWGPGRIPVGRRIRTPVSLVDLPPTILGLAGLPPLPDADGESQVARIDGGPEDPERVVFAEVARIKDLHERQFAARTATTKWILTASDSPELEAYDLVTDPGEQRPLDDPAVLERGRGLIDSYRALEAKASTPAEVPLGDDISKRLRDLGYAE